MRNFIYSLYIAISLEPMDSKTKVNVICSLDSVIKYHFEVKGKIDLTFMERGVYLLILSQIIYDNNIDINCIEL